MRDWPLWKSYFLFNTQSHLPIHKYNHPTIYTHIQIHNSQLKSASHSSWSPLGVDKIDKMVIKKSRPYLNQRSIPQYRQQTYMYIFIMSQSHLIISRSSLTAIDLCCCFSGSLLDTSLLDTIKYNHWWPTSRCPFTDVRGEINLS